MVHVLRKLPLIGWILAYGFVAALIAVEAGYFLDLDPPWSRNVALFWVIGSVAVLASTWIYALSPFFDRSLWRAPFLTWYLIAFLLPPALILVDIGGVTFTSVDGEGAHQLMDGLAMLGEKSLGIYRVAYYSYPDRQYLLNCLPTYFFGPSFWTLRLGNSIFYMGAYLFFLAALQKYLRGRQMTDALLWTAFAGTMISMGGYALMLARKFEQVTMPSGVMLLFLGALLLFVLRPTALRFVWVTWAFGWFPYCYTPAEGGWALALVILLYVIFQQRHWMLLLTIGYGLLAHYVVYRFMRVEHALDTKFDLVNVHFTYLDWLWRYIRGWRAIVGNELSLVPVPLFMAALAAFLLSWRYRDYRFPLLCLWCVGIVFCSLTILGSSMRAPSFDVQRALQILPPLALGTVFILNRYFSEFFAQANFRETVRWTLRIGMIFVFYSGIYVPFLARSYFEATQEGDNDEIFERVNEMIVSHNPDLPQRIYVIPPFDFNPEPVIHYLLPNVEIIRGIPPSGEKKPGFYTASYISNNPHDHVFDMDRPSQHRRPYIRFEKE